MSITTGLGDDGTTRLFSGEKVNKYGPRPSAYGDIDELVSILSVARASCQREATREALLQIQRLLFVAGSEVATMPARLQRLPRRIQESDVKAIEESMTLIESSIQMPTAFIVPGSTMAAAQVHHARSVARRVERTVARLAHAGDIANAALLVWLNRLSDYLYLLALTEEDELVAITG